MRETIRYTLVRSARLGMTIRIKDGEVEVRAPLQLPLREIERMVASQARWITEQQAATLARAVKRAAFTLNYGDTVTYRGGAYPLSAKEGGHAVFDGERFYLPPGLTPEEVKQAVVQLYRQLAKRHIPKRAAFFAKQMNAYPSAVKINGAKTRWGSCSARKSLNFSWRLMLADDDAIDYVVVHELAHSFEMNHSPRFWAIVAGVVPDCAARRERLKALQRRLGNEHWE